MAFKVVVCGPAGSGKTQLVRCLVGKKFEESYKATIGVEFGFIDIEQDDKKGKLEFVDMAGRGNFFWLDRSNFKDSTLVVITYDLTQPLNDQEVIIRKYLEAISKDKILFVGTKYNEAIDTTQFKQFAEELDFKTTYCINVESGIPEGFFNDIKVLCFRSEVTEVTVETSVQERPESIFKSEQTFFTFVSKYLCCGTDDNVLEEKSRLIQ